MKITYAIMLGVFMGIVPIWGYQMLATLFLAHVLKLNKVIAIVAANISIPPMIPFLLYGIGNLQIRFFGLCNVSPEEFPAITPG